MRRIFLAACLAAAACTSDDTAIRTSTSELSAVPVDIDRYMGKWYEVARYPNRFEDGCVGVTAEYERVSKARIKVTNTCREGSLAGPVEVADGRARVVGEGKLDVSFLPGGLSFLDGVASGGYWVIWLDPDYRMAVVVSPGFDFGWILARQPQPEPALIEAAKAALTANDYNLDALIWVEQGPNQATE